MASVFWSFFLVLNSVVVLCSATISNPRNTAVVARQRMEMKCRNDSGHSFRSWQTHRVSDEQEQTIFQYKGQGSHFPQFGIDRTNPGSVTLYSNSTLSSDAGVYRCTSLDTETSGLVTYSAHLIVLESHPDCQTDLSDQVITIRCSVRFKGNMIPQIEWRQSEIGASNGGQSVAHGVSTSDNGHIISTLNIIVDFPQPRIFTFKTFFLPTSTSSDDNNYAAVNAPDYTYTWKSIPIGGVPSPSSSIAPSSQSVKSFPPDNNGGESLKLSASTSSATAGNGESTISFVFEHWILISVCVGVAVLVSVIVAALFSYSRCLRKKRKAKEQPVNGIAMPQFGTYADMQRSVDTYCSIGDEFACEGNTADGVSPQMILAQRSLSAPGSSVRTLPRPPPAQPAVSNPSYYILPPHHTNKQSQRTNTLSHTTRQNGQRGIGFTSALSTSLPTIYQEEDSVPPMKTNPRVPVQNGHRESEASSYLAAQDVLVDDDDDAEMSIPSMYLRVNKLSERNS